MEGLDLQLSYQQLFGAKSVYGLNRFPTLYHRLTASSIWTYSVRCVPYRLLLAPVIRPPSSD